MSHSTFRQDAAPVAQTKAKAPELAPPPAPSKANFDVLKARQQELASQLESVNDRRDNLLSNLRTATGAEEAGINGRVAILDQRLIQIETDLSSVGRQLAAAAPPVIERPPRDYYRGFDEEDMWGAGFAGSALMFALFVPFIIRNFFRRKRGDRPMVQPVVGGERLDRMENAIDSIAVEMERVSENQRFMTRLMTETQLAGTIAAVRGSTELARAAAEAPSNDR